MDRAAAIQLRGLHKNFGAVHAVRGIDLCVPAGQMVAFLGPNGAGKTTTIDMMLGLSRPTTGTVEIYGTTPGRAIRKGLVSAVMQTGGLLKDLSVAETVEFTAALCVAPRPVAEVLERAGLTEVAGRMVGKCSGGEQQRLRFAMALLPDPALLILDEPTQGMDVEGRREFWRAIRADARRGRTVLFATHYLDEADDHADRIVLVRRGEIVADGTPAQVKARAAGRAVRATLPEANVAELRALPGVSSVEQRGNSVLVTTADSDLLARHLLTRTPARDLEIAAVDLEDAFVALTADDPTGVTG